LPDAKVPIILFNHYKEKEKNMKRHMFVLASLMLAASMILAACGTPATQAPAPATAAPATAAPATEAPVLVPTATAAPTVAQTEVTFWHAYGTGSAEEEALTAVLAQAAIDLPQYKINVLQVPFNDIFNKYSTDVAAGGGPDMFVAPNDSLGDQSRTSLIADITDLVSGKLGEYAPLSVEGMTVGGKVYGIPESLKAVEFWYDKSKLPTPPATTDELKKLMEGGTPIGISFGCYHYWGFYSAFGGKIFDDKFAFVSDQGTGMVDAMTYLNDLYQIAKKNGWPKTDSDGLAPFQEGKIVAITNGNWAMGDYQKALGDNLAVAPLPAGPVGPSTPLLGVDGYYINPNSQNKEGAIAVALYLTGVKAEQIMMDQAGHVPAINGVNVTNPLIKSLIEAFKTSIVRPQDAQLGKYWANFCGSDQIFEKGVAPAAWVATASEGAKK
jgi:arabinogalactan oligomer/maltooligosaccharide transport system substrate-binding protein